MIFVNNYIKPCLVCGEPIHKEGAFICTQCWEDVKKPSDDEYTEDEIKEMLSSSISFSNPRRDSFSID